MGGDQVSSIVEEFRLAAEMLSGMEGAAEQKKREDFKVEKRVDWVSGMVIFVKDLANSLKTHTSRLTQILIQQNCMTQQRSHDT